MKPKNQSENKNKTTAAIVKPLDSAQQSTLAALDTCSKQALTFLKAFNYSGSEPVRFQVVDDITKDQNKTKKLQTVPETVPELLEELHRCNLEGLNIYLTLNGTKAQFIQTDINHLEEVQAFELKPSLIVQAGNMLFIYWVVLNDNLSTWQDIQTRLLYKFDTVGDIIKKDYLLPVPGFSYSGEVVKVLTMTDYTYTQSQFIELLPDIMAEIEEDRAKAQGLTDNQAEQNNAFIDDFLKTIQTDAYKPYKTELSFFDDLLCGGVIRQSIVQVLAAPSTGKTTLCQEIAEEMAGHGKKVIYFNFEMSKEQMLAKAISYRLARKNIGEKSIISATDILQGYNWNDSQRERITEELNNYKATAAHNITYTSATTDLEGIKLMLEEIGEKSKQRGKSAPVVFVDYLHLITGAGSDNQETIKNAVKYFKDYAINYNTIVFLIVAMNKTDMKAGTVNLYSGRDTSAIEYAGDYTLTLNYEELENGNINADDEAELSKLKARAWRKMILRVVKHRLGVPGKNCSLWYRPAANIFYNSVGEFLPLDTDHERELIENEARERTLANLAKKKKITTDQTDKNKFIKQDDTPPASFLKPKKA